LRWRPLRFLIAFGGIAAITFVAYRMIQVNATTVGFAYLLFVLVIASSWGFLEAVFSSILATLTFNFFFFHPVATFTIADPQNWVALFGFLSASLIGSRLSALAKQQALEATERQQDLARLYAFSRAILLIEPTDPFARCLVDKLVETLELDAALLYECRTDEFTHMGRASLDGVDDELRLVAQSGTPLAEAQHCRVIIPVRLGSGTIGSLALQGRRIPDTLLEGMANLVAIGLERAKAQDLAQQIEAVHQSEQLRSTLIDAMAHEFKTPLTLIKGVTTALLDHSEELSASDAEQLRIADTEANHLKELIDNSVEMARLDTEQIDVHPERHNVEETLRELIQEMQGEIDERPLGISSDETVPEVAFDRRLLKLATKQLIDNALKYSLPGSPISIRAYAMNDMLNIEIQDHGNGIPLQEQARIFERFYRGPSTKQQIPGSGLGLSIAHRIAQAHNGGLTVVSRPGETTFRLSLPLTQPGETK